MLYKSLFASICPAYAGVIPEFIELHGLEENLSRVCGGDPGNHCYKVVEYTFVPRMRG